MKMEGPRSENAADMTSKETLIKRYKLKPIWRLFMIVNLGLGAYMFVKPKKKTTSKEANRGLENDKIPVEAFLQPSATSIPERPPTPVIPEERERVPEDQQHDLLKWILEEKRKIKPRDLEEKKRIDEESHSETFYTLKVQSKSLIDTLTMVFVVEKLRVPRRTNFSLLGCS